MKRKIKVLLDRGWVLDHRDERPMPITAIKERIRGTEGLEAGRDTFMSLEVFFDDKTLAFEDVKEKLSAWFCGRYPAEEDRNALTVTLEDKAADGAPAGPVKLGHGGDWTDPDGSDVLDADGEQSDDDEDDEDDDEEEDDSSTPKDEAALLKSILAGLDVGEEESESGAEDGSGVNAVMKEVEGLIGAQEFKALAREIVKVAPEIKRRQTFSVFENRTYLFSIGDGCGLTTYLNLLARLVKETGLKKFGEDPDIVEVKLDPFKETMEPFEQAIRALEKIGFRSQDVVLVDLSEWIERTENRNFRKFLRVAEKATKWHLIVFRVPFVEKDLLENVRRSLGDLLSVRTVSFPPFTQGEIKSYAERSFEKYGFQMSDRAWTPFGERIAEEKCDGRFYGLNTVNKVVRELIYTKQLADSGKKSPKDMISLRDARSLCGRRNEEDLVSAEEQLGRLVGCESVKAQIAEIVAQIELAKRTSGERPCIHMRFVGNPGTGKTTVARILGKLLREKGLLRIGRFYEYAGRDFCGRYIGETAPKTASICRDAYGSVLFIDEAYSLYHGESDEKDFGREVIDTLIAEMENHRDDFVVIMAGYTDEMDRLMNSNQGLKSRMPYTVEFPSFSREDLGNIFVSVAKDRFRCEEQLFDAARKYFMNLPDDLLRSKTFSNARFARNLFERTWAKAAMRCQLTGKGEVVLLKEDFERAVGEKDFAFDIPKKPRLGF